MRTWGNLLRILSKESPWILAKEAVWRSGQRQRKMRFARLVDRAGCPVRFRNIPYYRPILSSCSDQAAATIVQTAEHICQGRFPLLSYEHTKLGFPPPWHVDFVSGQSWDLLPGKSLTIVRHDGSDIKAVWELSRLQCLPILGKAYRLTGEERYRQAGQRLTSDWLERNPVGRGANWTTPMEVALRAMSVVFLISLLSPLRPDEDAWLERVTLGLWQHLLYIESYLEFSHISRSNHYLSNIVGLYCLSAFLSGAGMELRREDYRSRVQKEILHQVYDDGGDYEASLGYHVLVVQLFTSALLVMRAEGVAPEPWFAARLQQMYELLASLSDESGRLPHVGDCDDGRVELLAEDLEQIFLPVELRNSLAISGVLGIGGALFNQTWQGRQDDALWYGIANLETIPPAPRETGMRVFSKSGIAVARTRNIQALFFAMPNGIHGKGSHAHNDKLSFVLRIGGCEIFIDSGTGCYTRDLSLRNKLRSIQAHNTVIVNGGEQNTIPKQRGGAFSLGDEARVTPLECQATEAGWQIRASHSGYKRMGVTHSRLLSGNGNNRITIEDALTGSGQCSIEANYHLDPKWKVASVERTNGAVCCRLHGGRVIEVRFEGLGIIGAEVVPARISRLYGVLLPTERVSVRMAGVLPLVLRCVIGWED